MSEKYWMTIIEGPEVGTQFILEKNEIWIGREKGLDLSINNLEVTRKHAKLTLNEGNYFIDDNRSTNGTFVNGERVVIPTKLLNGDIIKIGSQVSLKFDTFTSDPDATLVSNKISEDKNLGSALKQKNPVKPPPISEAISTGSAQHEEKSIKKEEIVRKKTRIPGWVIILIIVAIFVIVFCVIPFIVIELGNLWCKGFLGNIFQSIAPGSCY